MQIEIDLKTVPPTVALSEPDDFKGFAVVIAQTDHASISVAELARLAGDRAADEAWRGELEKMLDYADSKGWIGPDGSIQAHIEWR